MGAVSRLENGWASGLGVRLLSRRGGMAEQARQRIAIAQATPVARRFESCCLRPFRSGELEKARGC